MKKIIFLLILFLTGCSENSESIKDYNFYYNNKVVIKDGFYKGQKGIIKEKYNSFYYYVLIDNQSVYIRTNNMELLEEIKPEIENWDSDENL